MMQRTASTGTSRPGRRRPVSASSRSSRPPTTPSWNPRACPVFRDIGISQRREPAACTTGSARAASGHYIQLYGTETKWGCYVVEVPPGGALNPEKHMYEEIYLVVEGRGTTEVWQEGDSKKHVFEWQKGSMFSIPMNAWFRIVNATSGGALLLAGNTAPNVHEHDQQRRRGVQQPVRVPRPLLRRRRLLQAQGRHRARSGARPRHAHARTSSPTSINCELPLDNRRSVGYRRVEPFMTNNQFYYWIGQHENGRYSKAHAHTSAAVLICLKGKGYTYSWPERCGPTPWKDGYGHEVRRLDYEPVRHGHGGAGRRALVSPALLASSKDDFRLTAWFGPHNPGRDPGAPGAEAHRLHRHRPRQGRHRHPLLDGRPVPAQGIRGDAEAQRRRQPHGPRMVRAAERRRREARHRGLTIDNNALPRAKGRAS